MAIEYSKIVRLPVTPAVNGFSTDLVLPSAFSFGSGGGFINFYVGFGDYECGISTRNGESSWHWFANSGAVSGTDAGGTYGEFVNGDTVNISLQLLLSSGSNYVVKFYVNGIHRHSFAPTYSSTTTFSNGRVVLACAQGQWDSSASIPNPLPAFTIRHNQVKTFNTKYRNASGTWVNVNSSNCTPGITHSPTGYTTPAPVDYSVSAASFGSGIYYASVKV